MKAILVTFLLPLLFICSVTARADETLAKPADSESKPPPQKTYKISEEHQYSGSKLKGQLKKPDLSYIYQRKGLRAERIVNVPENFDEEIIGGAGQF
jgi:hypothetical protein